METDTDNINVGDTERPQIMQDLPAGRRENTIGYMAGATIIWRNGPTRQTNTHMPPRLRQSKADPNYSALLDDGRRRD